MLQPESFIVRIYRRDSLRQVKGVVEIVRNGKRVGFATPEDLWAVIVPGARRPAGRRGPAKRG